MANHTEDIETLAAEIADKVYIDVAKWHLRLDDAHLHLPLAERLYPLLEDNALDENRVVEILGSIPVKVGGGRRELPLVELLPMQCQVQLMDILEEFQRRL
ncbi:DUF3181 family protein [Oxynema sp. CENA135]|jgi:hypothetical protein|uniref:DUF3181 family protein n=1 Tax=Oxynema aestuarii AP17 TaxID=2064643 RepID=A0A6H1U0R8_9CYAN|nr:MULTISPECIES: DUF3181 family protein [Oxynema]MBK4729884.1 DUF3181 family protein [Oxynema sp. CENA135]QIZ71997.1 DUF3181 family protein [Oxynema aestuarii AP17]RMH72416.1 MAG: DUF3181 family protein [Cyanobacteria bacterium J007]